MEPNKAPTFSGELEPFAENTFGVQYIGIRENLIGTNILHRFINGKNSTVTVWACRTVILNNTEDGLIEGPIKGPEQISIPSKHASTFEFPAPNERTPWRCTFDTNRSISDRIPSKFGKFFDFPFLKPQPPINRNLRGNHASPVMIGLKPAEEPQQYVLGKLPFVNVTYPNLSASEQPKNDTAENIWTEE